MNNFDYILWELGNGFMPKPVQDFLFRPILKTKYIEINGWSFVHLLSGYVYKKIFVTSTLLSWLIVHTLWEVYQISIGMTDIKYISEWVDIFLDTVFALVGYIIV